MAFNFTGKKILVTGAGRGIGRGMCVALHKSGCKVYALSRTKSSLDTLVELCPGIVPITQDLANWEETRSKLEELEPMDGLVNNAGVIDYTGLALDWTKEKLDHLLTNNLYSVINCTQIIAKKMVETKRAGSIVNNSSVIAQKAVHNYLGYNVSKAGMDMATKQFALELGTHNIRVNSISPTLVLTDIVKDYLANEGANFAVNNIERNPMGRLPTVDEIVGPVLYLLSDHSAMVTGTLHVIDGGVMCNITTKQ